MKRNGLRHLLLLFVVAFLGSFCFTATRSEALQIPNTWTDSRQSDLSTRVRTLLSYKKPTLYPTLDQFLQVVNVNLDKSFVYEEGIDVPSFGVEMDAQNNLNEERMKTYAEKMPYEDAIEDIKYLADLLPKAFGGINMFGGERAARLMEKHALSILPRSGMTYQEFEELLLLETSFIEDMHFWVDYQASVIAAEIHTQIGRWKDHFDADEIRVNKPRVARNVKLERLPSGDYLDLAEEKIIVLEKDASLSVEPFLADDFSVFYALLQYSNYRPLEEVTSIAYEDGLSRELVWEILYDNYLHVNVSGGEAESFGSVYYIDLRGDVFRDPWDTDFLSFGDKAKQYPYVIVDLRGNTGGNDMVFGDFLTRLLRQDDRHLFDVPYYRAAPLTKSEFNMLQEDGVIDLIGDKMSYFPPEPRALTSSNRLIVVLIDNNTASAGEYAVGSIRSGKNVLVIGTNTPGLATSSVGELFVLPHSKIPLRVPMIFNFWHPDYYSVNEGFRPDIWARDFEVDTLIDFLNAQGDQ